MHEPLFTVSGLTKVYQTGDVTVHALRGVDAVLYESELAVMLGPSGSGKSTLLNILGGLDSASSGSVRFRDEELTRFSDRELTLYRRDHVGFVFQFYNLVPSLTAKENVALVTEIARHPMAPEEALGIVGLKKRVDHFPAQLSGGEQQRVAIARAIAKRPEILLCDEPTGALELQDRRAGAGGADPGQRRSSAHRRRSSRTMPRSRRSRIACCSSPTAASRSRWRTPTRVKPSEVEW